MVDSNNKTHISDAKLANTSPGAILRAYDEIMADGRNFRSPAGEFWRAAFHEDTLRPLSHLRASLMQDCRSAARRALRGLLLGALHGARTKGSPSYLSNQMPRTFAPKPDYAVRYWRERGLLPPHADPRKIIERRAYRFFGSRARWAKGRVVQGDSRLPEAQKNAVCESKVDWVITSPPYYGMRTYMAKRVLAALDARLNHAPVRLDIERRLTVKEFAFVIERSEEYVRRQIRGRVIPKELLDGPPYKINARAIKLFAVTPELAAARLALLQKAALPAQNRRKAA